MRRGAVERVGAGEFFIGNLLVRIHLIIVMIRWTGLAPWEFEFRFPGSLTSTFLQVLRKCDEERSNAVELEYDERNPFVVCTRTFKPIYRYLFAPHP